MTRIAFNEKILQCRQGVCGKLSYLLVRKTTKSPAGATLFETFHGSGVSGMSPRPVKPLLTAGSKWPARFAGQPVLL